ncbi:hypothetical protein HMPREF1624_01726 [Sporothrix schenckii ATCC 58251]|uniref:DUF7730 domain-containing protein n=2 Tax=Sporothrix schenckii TaxID=29908 RepID=U7Q9I3_SPOS1|nr:hypothetical protein HMPREF1624_01726 [Sporothrix schenckii ATCC 58251]
MLPSVAWLKSPIPRIGGRNSSSNSNSRSSSHSRGDGERTGDTQQQQQVQPPQPPQPPQQQQPSPWTRQVNGFTSAPCFLHVDNDDDDGYHHRHHVDHSVNGRRDSLQGSSTAPAHSPRRPPEADDIRPQRLAAAHRADLDAVAANNSIYDHSNSDSATPSSTWRARWNSPWLGHWACEEYYSGAAKSSASESNPETAAASASFSSLATTPHSHSHRRRRPPLRRPYLPVLLTCRRAYVEGIDLLYSALTFQFTEMSTAQDFLARWPCVSSVRLVMHLSNSLLEFYLRPDDSDQAIITAAEAPPAQDLDHYNQNHIHNHVLNHIHNHDAGTGAVTINARNNAWQRLCAGFAADRLPNLRRLHVWVEAHDLRGWPKTAAETRLFAQLLDAARSQRRLTPERFVLYLPTLPPVGSKERELKGCYLGEDEDGGDNDDNNGGKEKETHVLPARLPCTIVRTERPDYWDVHMHMRPVYVNRRMSVGSRVSALRRAGFL